MLGDLLTRCLVLFFGYAYPAFECFKSVEKNKVDIAELRFWCQYWIIVGLLTVCERVGDIFVSWLPMYGETKLAFIIYLWYPKTMGTSYIYQTLLRPFVAKHETDIDRKLLELKARAWDLALYYWQNCTKMGQSTFFQILEYLATQSGKLKTNGSEKANGYEPSGSPVSSPNEMGSAGKQGKRPPRPPMSQGPTMSRSLSSESPKVNRGSVQLDNQSEHVQTFNADNIPDGDVNEKLHQFRMRLRRSNPIHN
ncbi:hypothetical protein K2173_012158 [Erythroxylum novogranatense]|uniref:HVA22-like protein n=1 Tax=Erythroxylum novogranatense TaxID=1862640 RepID=A0AAV8SSD0_9ROSI|nr:hypothetical protein K2173_012158 [Erythroxylum novogranatense]